MDPMGELIVPTKSSSCYLPVVRRERVGAVGSINIIIYIYIIYVYIYIWINYNDLTGLPHWKS